MLALALLIAVAAGEAEPALRHGIQVNQGGSGSSHYPLPPAVLRCLAAGGDGRGGEAHVSHGPADSATAVVALSLSGWAPVPSFYNISAAVQSVRNAKAVGLRVWITMEFREISETPAAALQPTLSAMSAAVRPMHPPASRGLHSCHSPTGC